jgi:hypothetical protein
MMFETVKNEPSPPNVARDGSQHGETNMARNTNVVTLPKSESQISVERSIKSHNEVSKKKPLPIASGDFTTVVDFSTCTPAEIMAIAVDAIIVTVQAKTRSAYFAKTNIGKDGKTPIKSFNMIMRENIPPMINVKAAIVAKARQPGKSLEAKFMENFAKLTPAQKAAKLAELGLK